MASAPRARTPVAKKRQPADSIRSYSSQTRKNGFFSRLKSVKASQHTIIGGGAVILGLIIAAFYTAALVNPGSLPYLSSKADDKFFRAQSSQGQDGKWLGTDYIVTIVPIYKTDQSGMGKVQSAASTASSYYRTQSGGKFVFSTTMAPAVQISFGDPKECPAAFKAYKDGHKGDFSSTFVAFVWAGAEDGCGDPTQPAGYEDFDPVTKKLGLHDIMVYAFVDMNPLVHELGHALGLAHFPNANCSTEGTPQVNIMNCRAIPAPFPSLAQSQKDQLGWTSGDGDGDGGGDEGGGGGDGDATPDPTRPKDLPAPGSNCPPGPITARAGTSFSVWIRIPYDNPTVGDSFEVASDRYFQSIGYSATGYGGEIRSLYIGVNRDASVGTHTARIKSVSTNKVLCEVPVNVNAPFDPDYLPGGDRINLNLNGHRGDIGIARGQQVSVTWTGNHVSCEVTENGRLMAKAKEINDSSTYRRTINQTTTYTLTCPPIGSSLDKLVESWQAQVIPTGQQTYDPNVLGAYLSVEGPALQTRSNVSTVYPPGGGAPYKEAKFDVGARVTVTWNSTKASACTLEPYHRTGLKGSLSMTLNQSEFFTLTCTDSAGHTVTDHLAVDTAGSGTGGNIVGGQKFNCTPLEQTLAGTFAQNPEQNFSVTCSVSNATGPIAFSVAKTARPSQVQCDELNLLTTSGVVGNNKLNFKAKIVPGAHCDDWVGAVITAKDKDGKIIDAPVEVIAHHGNLDTSGANGQMKFSAYDLTLGVGESQKKTVTITGGTPPYKFWSQGGEPNSSVARAEISGNIVTVTGVGAGTTGITIEDSLNTFESQLLGHGRINSFRVTVSGSGQTPTPSNPTPSNPTPTPPDKPTITITDPPESPEKVITAPNPVFSATSANITSGHILMYVDGVIIGRCPMSERPCTKSGSFPGKVNGQEFTLRAEWAQDSSVYDEVKVKYQRSSDIQQEQQQSEVRPAAINFNNPLPAPVVARAFTVSASAVNIPADAWIKMTVDDGQNSPITCAVGQTTCSLNVDVTNWIPGVGYHINAVVKNSAGFIVGVNNLLTVSKGGDDVETESRGGTTGGATHLECVNNACMAVGGAGVNTGGCLSAGQTCGTGSGGGGSLVSCAAGSATGSRAADVSFTCGPGTDGQVTAGASTTIRGIEEIVVKVNRATVADCAPPAYDASGSTGCTGSAGVSAGSVPVTVKVWKNGAVIAEYNTTASR